VTFNAPSVERDVEYVPEKGADPRLLLTGKTIAPASGATATPKVYTCSMPVEF
jgi:hypothetical protein